jgi:quercetin dioxygenase-like cupin family protein
VALDSHTHTFTHKSSLVSGRAVVRAGGVEELVVAPAVLTIQSGVPHSVRAVVDSVWYCIHATSETDPDQIDHALTREH